MNFCVRRDHPKVFASFWLLRIACLYLATLTTIHAETFDLIVHNYSTNSFSVVASSNTFVCHPGSEFKVKAEFESLSSADILPSALSFTPVPGDGKVVEIIGSQSYSEARQRRSQMELAWLGLKWSLGIGVGLWGFRFARSLGKSDIPTIQ